MSSTFNTASPSADKCFIPFEGSVEQYTLPIKFTYPFSYDAHPLCQEAAKELQYFLSTQTSWEHNFGLCSESNEPPPIGKMFGVLVVKNSEGVLGYLRGFSGDLLGNNDISTFVPPVNDQQKSAEFYQQCKSEVSAINLQLEGLELTSSTSEAAQTLQEIQELSQLDLAKQQERLKNEKEERRRIREKALTTLSTEEYNKLNNQLINESCQNKFYLKHLKEHWNRKIIEAQQSLNRANSNLVALKRKRKEILSSLQVFLLNQYQFLNILGETKGINEIFGSGNVKAPAGSGDCAAPKLLQYALKNDLIPIAMAEFWWGASPKSAVRNHTHFYPSCKSRCKPILGHMLKGLEVDSNPLLQNAGINTIIETVYEDEELLVINKPSGLLSVPGKTIVDSVATRLKELYPKCTGPLIVHRLDQCTSGIMLIAKSKKSYDHLQQQFIKRTVKKSYIAQLDGIVESDCGVIDLPLRVDLDNRPYQLVCYEHGKKAMTHYKVLKRDNGKTRVHFTPITGRTHQLRVHSAHVKGLHAPITGDTLYGSKSSRLHLHANWIELTHPSSQKRVFFEVPPPF